MNLVLSAFISKGSLKRAEKCCWTAHLGDAVRCFPPHSCRTKPNTPSSSDPALRNIPTQLVWKQRAGPCDIAIEHHSVFFCCCCLTTVGKQLFEALLPLTELKFGQNSYSDIMLSICHHTYSPYHCGHRTMTSIPWQFGTNTCTVTPILFSTA